MGLETPVYINDLVTTNPLSSDTKAQGDDHIRNIKVAVKGSFPDSTRAWYVPKGTTLQTSTVTIVAADENKLIPVSAEAANRTVNLPAFSTIPDGYRVGVVKADHSTGVITVDGNGSETINGALTQTIDYRFQVAWFQYVSDISMWIMDIMAVIPPGSITAHIGNNATQVGWLFCNGQSIGNASSSGTARANADTLALFQQCWNRFSDTVCPVSGGRGATAVADFAANKNLGLPNLAGRALVGLDNLGGISAAGVLTGKTTNGEGFGAESATLTAAKIPNLTVAVAITDPSHSHFTMKDVGNPTVVKVTALTTAGNQGSHSSSSFSYAIHGELGDADVAPSEEVETGITATGAFGTTERGGAQTATDLVQPSFATNWIVKY